MLDAFVRHDALPSHVVLTSSRAVYGEGPWQAEDGTVFAPPPRSHAQLEAAQWDHLDAAGRPATPIATVAATRRTTRAASTARPSSPRSWSCATGRPASRCRSRSSGPRTSTAPASRRTTPTPGSSPLPPARLARGDPRRLRGRRDQPRLRLHRRRGGGARRRHRAAAGRPAGARPGQRRPHHHPRRGPDDRGPPRAPEPQISGRFRDGDVRSAWADVDLDPRGPRLGADLELRRRQRGRLRLAEAGRVPWLSRSRPRVTWESTRSIPARTAGPGRSAPWSGSTARWRPGSRPCPAPRAPRPPPRLRGGPRRASAELLPDDRRLEVIDATGFAHVVKGLPKVVDHSVLLMTARVLLPLVGIGTATAAIADDIRVAAVSFLSNAAGHLSFPQPQPADAVLPGGARRDVADQVAARQRARFCCRHRSRPPQEGRRSSAATAWCSRRVPPVSSRLPRGRGHRDGDAGPAPWTARRARPATYVTRLWEGHHWRDTPLEDEPVHRRLVSCTHR